MWSSHQSRGSFEPTNQVTCTSVGDSTTSKTNGRGHHVIICAYKLQDHCSDASKRISKPSQAEIDAILRKRYQQKGKFTVFLLILVFGAHPNTVSNSSFEFQGVKVQLIYATVGKIPLAN